MNFIGLILSLFIILWKPYKGLCLRITRMEADNPIIAHEGGWLRCEWEEGDRRIYTTKWYIGQHEFYRWTPSDPNPIRVFKRPEFDVDVSRSRRGHVYIKNVSNSAKGLLRCEVSEEGPIFHTEHNVTHLNVVDLPDTRPIINGLLPVYQLQRDVALTCISSGSKPAAQLTFYINGEPADRNWLLPYRATTNRKTGLKTAALTIRFPLLPKLLRRDRVHVKCAAKLLDLYWESNEVEVIVDFPHRASRMEERASTHSGSARITIVNILELIALSYIIR